MKLENVKNANSHDFVDLDNSHLVWTSVLNHLMSPEDSVEFRNKMNARIMAEPDFEEDHLMKDSDLHDMARQAFGSLAERYREPYVDWIANLPQ